MNNSKCLNLSILCLKYTGIWVPDNLSFRNILLYIVFGFILQTFLFIFIIMAEIGYLYKVIDDTDMAVDAVVLLLSHLVQGVKVATIFFRQNRIKRLISMIDGPNFTKTDKKMSEVLEKTTVLTDLFGKVFITSAAVTATFWCMVPTLKSELSLPLRTAYPFDFSGWPMFGVMYAYTSISVVVVGVGDAAENFLVAALMILAGGQLDVLRRELEDASAGTDKGELDYGKVISCIKYHQHIIEYVDELANIFGFAIFCQFVTSSIILCMTVFKITITTEPIEITTLTFYLICILLELLNYSYPGNLLIHKSVLVSEAAYPSNWSGDARARKAMLLTCLRAQRPLEINAGGVFSVCLPTAAAVVQTSYSYYAVLQKAKG